MTKKDALKALSRRFPLDAEVSDYLDKVEKKEDREAAIMGGALLEGCFERCLSKLFKDAGPDVLGRVFQNRGPLSDLDGKMLLCQALNIVNDNLARELNIVRAVRNVFAHSIMDVTFETPEVKARLKESKLAESFFSMLSTRTFEDKEIEEAFREMYKDASGKDRYIFIIRCGCSVLGF